MSCLPSTRARAQFRAWPPHNLHFNIAYRLSGRPCPRRTHVRTLSWRAENAPRPHMLESALAPEGGTKLRTEPRLANPERRNHFYTLCRDAFSIPQSEI